MSSVLSDRLAAGIPFGRVVQRRKDTGAADLEPLSVYLEAGVVPRSSRDDNHNRLGADLSNYLAVEPGDIVFNKLRTWQGGLGVSRHRGIVSPAYFVCRPSPDFEPRFLHYLFRSAPYLAEFTRISKFMPPSQFDIAWDDLRLVPVPETPLSEQRAIADFLDTETARIDALIIKKRRLLDLSKERIEAHVSQLMDDAVSKFGERPLKAAVDLRISNVDKKSYEGEVGVRLCNYTDVYYHREIDSSIDFMSATASSVQVRRFALLAGDVLITKDSESVDDIAVPALVTESAPDLVLGYHLALLRPLDVDGRFLYWAIRTRRCRDEFSLAASGVTRMGLRQDAMGRVPIPDAPLEEQTAIATRIEAVARLSEGIDRRLLQQTSFLQEHRQALITAAVTGELEVPGVVA